MNGVNDRKKPLVFFTRPIYLNYRLLKCAKYIFHESPWVSKTLGQLLFSQSIVFRLDYFCRQTGINPKYFLRTVPIEESQEY